jgi:CHAD domain-containing protein
MTLSPDQPYAEAAAAIIAERSDAVFAHEDKDVLDIVDIEGVHAMRVATRRLRAALEIFRPSLDGKRAARTLVEVKALAAALGERRDRDVQLDLLVRLQGETTGAERRAVELLAHELRDEQRLATRRLAKALRHAKRSQLQRRLARLSK